MALHTAKERLRAGRSTLEAAYAAGLSGNGRLHDLFLSWEACTPGEFRQRGAGLTLYYDFYPSLFGLALIAATDRGITRIILGDDPAALTRTLHQDFAGAQLVQRPTEEQARAAARLNGLAVSADNGLRLDLAGTPFQTQIWRALLHLPPGQVASYGDLARAIGQPGASRAVGSAVGRNPVAVLIPCHRVVRANGALGQYAWGEGRKRSLLAWEQRELAHL